MPPKGVAIFTLSPSLDLSTFTLQPVAPKRSTASKEDIMMPAFMFSLPSCVRAVSLSCSRNVRLVASRLRRRWFGAQDLSSECARTDFLVEWPSGCGAAPTFSGPCTLWRTLGTRPIPSGSCYGTDSAAPWPLQWVPGKRLVWLSMGKPLRFPRGLGEPVDRRHHRSDGSRHMGKVDAIDFVAWLMVVRVKPEAGDGLGNDSPLCKAVVIGSLEEVLLGMRIGNQAGAV